MASRRALTLTEKIRARHLYINEGYNLTTLADYFGTTVDDIRSIVGTGAKRERRRIGAMPKVTHIPRPIKGDLLDDMRSSDDDEGLPVD